MQNPIDKAFLSMLANGCADPLFELILNSIPFRVFWKNRDLTYGGCNQLFCDDAGLGSPREIVGLNDFDLPWTEEEAKFYRSCDAEVMNKGEAKLRIVETQKRADGENEWLETSKIPLRNSKNRVVGILGVYHDITDLKKAEMDAIVECQKLEQDLIEASRKAGREEIATGVLHNIGNVMNSVNVGSNLIEEKLSRHIAQLDKIIELVEENSQHEHQENPLSAFRVLHSNAAVIQNEATELQVKIGHVNNVIAAQQSLAAGGGGFKSRFSLADLVLSSLQIVDEQLKAAKIIVHSDFRCESRLVSDEHRIAQILVNLFQNAINAINDLGASQPTIQVRITREPTSSNEPLVYVTIQDTGIGMSPETLDRVFQHGFSTRADRGGKGFGLHHSVVSILEMGGSLTAHSEGIGKGAKFILKIRDEVQPVKLPSQTLTTLGRLESDMNAD